MSALGVFAGTSTGVSWRLVLQGDGAGGGVQGEEPDPGSRCSPIPSLQPHPLSAAQVEGRGQMMVLLLRAVSSFRVPPVQPVVS